MWDNYESDQDQVYRTILNRAKEQLPDISFDDTRFVVPEVDSQVEGNRTFFRNFRDILTVLNRPETHFLKFFYQ